MSKIEEWWKTLDLPKFMPGEDVYIVEEGKAVKAFVSDVEATFKRNYVEYLYALEGLDDPDRFYYRDENNIYREEAEADLPCRIAGLESRQDSLSHWISVAEEEIGRLKGTTLEAIQARIKACEEDVNKWRKDLQEATEQLRSLRRTQEEKAGS